jgi:predicted regulator of Ras-like GTPase activity (Roadblock/LC7/MglB family)
MIADRLLHILEDVSGVMGSFVIGPDGGLLVHSMPEHFAASDLELTANRVARVLRCSAVSGVATQDGVFDFGEGKLLVREFVRGYLCVLCTAAVNMRSLRLTARLVARGLPAEL